MNYVLLWDGSEVAWVRPDGGDVLIRLSAAAVRAQEGNSTDAGDQKETGYLRPLMLRLIGATGLMRSDDWFGALSEGRVTSQGRSLRALPLPCHINGGVSVELRFKARDTLLLQAEALRCEVDADCVYAESYAC